MTPPNLRRLFLIDRRFQLGTAAVLFAVQFALLVLFAGLLDLFLRSEIEANLNSARVTYRNMREMLQPLLLTLALLNAVLSAVVITVFVVLRTHLIAGPLYRFQAVVDALGKRDTTAMTSIRKGDQLGPLADSLRALVATFGGDLETLRKETAALEAAVPAGPAGERLRGHVAALQAVLSAWKTQPPP
jgi:methyl-accepting chemotaxis protein